MKDPAGYIERSVASMGTRARDARFQRGSLAFDYGNNIRGQARKAGVSDAFEIPGFVPEFIRPLFCEGKGPFRWVALSGDPADIAATDRAVLEEFPDDAALARWIGLAGERVAFQGLPAASAGSAWGGASGSARLHRLSSGALWKPRSDQPGSSDPGSVASPYRETEAMKDGSDAMRTGRF